MIIYTKEKGNNSGYILNNDDKTVTFEEGKYVVSASLAFYTELDEKTLFSKYNDYKRIFKGDLMTLYRTNKYDGIKYFIRKVINNRNFVFSFTSKTYVLAKILYFTIMGRQSYSSRPGYSLSFISDIARLKDDLTYPLLFTCKNMTDGNFKKLCKVILNCPYYLTDFHNILKREVQRIYWSTNFDKYLEELGKYNLNEKIYYDQYITGFNMANLVERFTSGLKNSSGNEVKFIHDTEYKYLDKVRLDLSFSKVEIEYIDKRQDNFLHIIDDLYSLLHHLINDCMEIVHNNQNYDNELFDLLSYLFIYTGQENIEFQIPNSTWSTMIGIVDLCNDCVSPFYKQNKIVDNVILAHYTRINEYLKNHFDDKRAFSVFKVRVT